jgi:hypothetical protein
MRADATTLPSPSAATAFPDVVPMSIPIVVCVAMPRPPPNLTSASGMFGAYAGV